MSAPGQAIDPVMALAQQQQPAAAPMPQTGGMDPVQALAMGQGAPAPKSPTPAANNTPAPPVWADIAHSIPGGLAKGVAGIIGLPGDAAHLLDMGMDKLTGANVANTPNPGRPTSSDINSAISKPFGGYYKPQTVPGQYAETVASFAPSAAVPGSMAQRLARVLVPGVTSETAGQITSGTPLEAPARAIGALLGGVGEGGVEGVIAGAKNPAPTLDALQKAKDATYKAADQAGVTISPQSFQKFATDLGSNLTSQNVVQADIHPNALSALKVIQEEAASGAPISLSRADAIRQAVNGAIEKAAGLNGSKTDLSLSMKVKGGLDDYLDSLGPSDVVSGDPQTAVPILKQARDIAQRQFKGEQIQKMMDLAANSASTNYSASGYEQALRAQFKNFNAQLIKNPSLANTFSDEERAAMQSVAQGGPVGNALRYIGKFSAHGPVSSAAGMGIGAMLGHSVGAGAAEGGMAGAFAVPMIGEVGRAGATALTQRNANLAAALMRRGAPASTTAPSVVNSGLISLLLSQAH